MKFKSLQTATFASAGLMLTPAAFAHDWGVAHASFAAGLAHPFAGLDHVLTMLAVGLWAVQLGGAARWRVPLAFIAAMAGGAWLASAHGASLFAIESLIGLSVIALGLLSVWAVRLPTRWAAGIVALFALAHGAAHGSEMPPLATGWGYGVGFLLATAGLHGLGLGLGRLLQQPRWQRAGGAAVALAGAWLLVG